MEDKEVTNYLITALVGVKALVDKESEAFTFVEYALSLYPKDEVNKATIECSNGNDAGLIEEFKSAIRSRYSHRIVGQQAIETEEGTAWLWKVLKHAGEYTYLQTTELHTLEPTK